MAEQQGAARGSDCVVLATVPDGPLRSEHFAMQTEDVPDPGPGEVLVRVQAITIGAGQRAGLQGSASYAGAPEAGVVMRGTGAGVWRPPTPRGSTWATRWWAGPAGAVTR